MITDTEGIVLRQIKTSYNRRMIRLFTRSYGKISAGTSIGEKGRSKGALAIRPFTYGRYELFKNRDSFNINSAEVIKSFYGIGEDVEKYMHGAYVLEFTEKALPEEMAVPALFDLIVEFFRVLEKRDKGIGTLVLSYQIKLFNISGSMPELETCACCGKALDPNNGEKDGVDFAPAYFSIKEGGTVCGECAEKLQNSGDDTLIICRGFDIVSVLKFLAQTPLSQLENIALNKEDGQLLQRVIREYAAYHLDITDVKSEELV